MTDANGIVTQKYLNLAGGIKVTIKTQSTSAGATTYSLSNMHGDTMATVNADGAMTGTYMTGPFGEALTNTALPHNATPDTTYAYVGKHQKITETSFATAFIQMGARVYLPELGRFLQVDPVEGGTLNNYVYAMDPVNQADLDGRWIAKVLQAFVRFVKNPKQYIKNIRPYNYRPAAIPRGQPVPKAREYNIPKEIPQVLNPKAMAEAERQAINKAIQDSGWVSRTHQVIKDSLSDPKYKGWMKRACWVETAGFGASYFIEVHYNIDITTNVADDFKVKGWSQYKANGTGAKYPC